MMRPQFRVLSDADIDKIIDRAFTVLEKVGMHIGSPRVLKQVGSRDGVTVNNDRVLLGRGVVEDCLKQAPSEIKIYPQESADPLTLSGDDVHYVAGSVAPYVYDEKAGGIREPSSRDLVDHTKVLNHCEYIDFQSGSLVINDVPRPITSSYRYYLALLYSPKPMFGGAFGTDDLKVIRDMLAVVAGGEEELERKPTGVIATNPSSPLGLTEIVSENIVACAQYSLPAMLIPIPLAGGSSPVTLAGTLVQHTAEVLGGLVVSQTARPGAPVLFGGGPSIMDMQKGTACQASTEAVMMGAAAGQIAKRLNLPSATNTGRADSKRVDYQAGEESGIALTLMAIAGINMIRGAGTLEFANVVSKEKLLIDNEICGMAKRLVRPMDTAESALATDVILERATSSDGYLSSPHTMDWFKSEFYFPSSLIDRGSRREFEENGKRDAYGRACEQIARILAEYEPREMDASKKAELDRIMTAHARAHGMDKLPITEIG
jgi:trimethylamine--corrinoid protein Co-methyltransferase